MTALDSNDDKPRLSDASRSRLSRKGKKRALEADISPAPTPRASFRIQSNGSDPDLDKGKTSALPVPPIATSPLKIASQRLSLSRGGASLSRRRSSASPASHSPPVVGNGGQESGGAQSGRIQSVSPLANLGNTCFMNSVLYALRYLPGFTHDLHHLHLHLQALGENKLADNQLLLPRLHFLTELHKLYMQLNDSERNHSEVTKKIQALQPCDFLDSVRALNAMFKGNGQQDAHELLHCLLDQLCHLPQDLKGGTTTGETTLGTEDASLWSSGTVGSKRRRSERILAIEEDSSKAMDVVGSKFLGRMMLETKCSECEHKTGREEDFLEVYVPVKTASDFDEDENLSDDQIFMRALCEEECLRDTNKYWCDRCLHHNEARRYIHYSRLPHYLVIQVKRFSAQCRTLTTSNTGKCSYAMPAPFHLSCFCRDCSQPTRGEQPSRCPTKKGRMVNGIIESHLPYILMAVVCHLGASVSSGHYQTYVRVTPVSQTRCPEQLVGGGVRGASDCTWLKCCSPQTAHLLPAAALANGCLAEASDGDHCPPSISPANHKWLECDDDKIRLVTSADVQQMMRTTAVSPYLLFYSRVQ